MLCSHLVPDHSEDFRNDGLKLRVRAGEKHKAIIIIHLDQLLLLGKVPLRHKNERPRRGSEYGGHGERNDGALVHHGEA